MARINHLPTKLGQLILIWASLLGFVSAVLAQTGDVVPPYVANSPLLQLMKAVPEGGWVKVNTNLFSDVWTPDDLRPLDGASNPAPYKIIETWSGFAWDSNRGDLIIYGGGHHAYSGNDVYRWHSSSLQWERAALPSQITQLPNTFAWTAIDGVNAAPTAAHTYDNNIFLPIADRFLTWGGALYDTGGPYVRLSESDPTQLRRTGPYLFDPAKADGNKVGGTTGSHVQRVAPHPEIVGGNMWQNRDIYKNLAGSTFPDGHVNGCTGYAQENGHDVVYVGARIQTSLNLYRYELVDLAFPVLDRFAEVGIFWGGTAEPTTCDYEAQKKLFVRTGNNIIPFVFWDLAAPGLSNKDQRVDVTGSLVTFQNWMSTNNVTLSNCAMDFDPVRQQHLIWCGTGVVWALTTPAANVTYGWSMAQQRVPTTVTPPGDIRTGILGKWKYILYFDVFMGLMGPNNGDIWVYKPIGWQGPGVPLPPIGVSASNGTSATSVTVSWAASVNATSYTVYRSASSGSLGSPVGATNTTTLTDNTVVPGTVYYYSVVAIGFGGNSTPSAQDSGYAGSLPGGEAAAAFAGLAKATGNVAYQTMTTTTAAQTAGGSLAGSNAASTTTVNITAVGSIDWAKWPSYIYKATGGNQISTYVTAGAVAVQTYTGDQRTVTWTDGAPTASGSDQTGLSVSGIGSGFLITAPADTTSRTLYFYVGGSNSSGALIAHLSDGSAPDYVSTTSPTTGQYDLIYTITYRAASAGQHLSVGWTQVSGSGNVRLQGAALK